MLSIPVARAIFVGVVSVILLAGSGFARAAAIRIPASDLKTALEDYIRQSGVDLIYQADDVAGLHSSGVHVSTTPDGALEELLKGTGTVIHRDPSGAVIVSRAEAAPEPEIPRPLSMESVIVTGSRVLRNGDTSPTPLIVVDAIEVSATTPSNIPDGLNKLPMFQGSRSQRTTGGSTINWPGNFLNLREFGMNRTLILLDGKRVPYTDMSGDVDTNTLPLALMERVDIVTGGASAVYGSDAITGVVNFVLNHAFNGLKATAQGGVSQMGDDPSWKVGLIGGAQLWSGRGHAEFSYEHYDSAGIDTMLNRPLGNLIPSVLGAGTPASPYYTALNTRNVNLTPGGYITAGALAGFYFSANGVLSPFSHGQTGNGINEVGGNGGYAGESFADARANPWLMDSLTSDQIFGRFDFALSQDLNIYLQEALSQSSNYGVSFVQQKAGVFAADNAFLPAGAASLLAAAGQSSFAMARSFQNETGTVSDGYTASNNLTLGASGTTFGHYDWDAHYTFGRSSLHEKAPGVFNQQRLTAALDAVNGPSGTPVCRVSLNPAGAAAYPGCVPFNAFGPTSESAAAWAYTHDNVDYKTTNEMHDMGGNISGVPFRDWAGPVTLSLDLEYRITSFTNDSAFSPTTLVDCAYLNPLTCNSGLAVWNGSTANFPTKSESVIEGAMEGEIPLASGLPWAETVNFNGAARFTNYSISGPAITWKGGLVWDVGGGLVLRGTVSRDIRAPTLGNLFAPASANYTAFTDYLTGTTGETTVSGQGNPLLKPEVSRTNTLGFVYKPDWLPDFHLAADYYQIGINNVITSVSGGAISSEQVCIASGGSSAYCALVLRPFPISNTTAANFPTKVLSESLNAGKMTTHGIDAEVEYNVDLGLVDERLAGMLGMRTLVAYQPSLLSSSPVPNAPITNQAGAETSSSYALASGRVTFDVSYIDGPLTLNLQERWHGSERRDANPTLVYSDPPIPQIFYTDLTFAYALLFARDDRHAASNAAVFLTIENLFDRGPALFIAPARTGAEGYTYPAPFDEDVVGRYFTAGIRFEL